MNSSYLSEHLALLLSEDSPSAQTWRRLSPVEQNEYVQLWHLIDQCTPTDGITLDQAHLDSLDVTRRWFVRIQERGFQYAPVRVDWAEFIGDAQTKLRLYEAGRARLQSLVDLYFPDRNVLIYGRIKSDDGIRSRIESHKNSGTEGLFPDLWDVIGFRIVTPSLDELLDLGIVFWERLIDHIVRCRNYYYRPKDNNSRGIYRGIHFELVDEDGNLTEAQLVTRFRDAVSLLDHQFSFKRVIPFINEEHERWLTEMSKKANILEVQCAQGPAALARR
jgi:hypothetical protein